MLKLFRYSFNILSSLKILKNHTVFWKCFTAGGILCSTAPFAESHTDTNISESILPTKRKLSVNLISAVSNQVTVSMATIDILLADYQCYLEQLDDLLQSHTELLKSPLYDNSNSSLHHEHQTKILENRGSRADLTDVLNELELAADSAFTALEAVSRFATICTLSELSIANPQDESDPSIEIQSIIDSSTQFVHLTRLQLEGMKQLRHQLDIDLTKTIAEHIKNSSPHADSFYPSFALSRYTIESNLGDSSA